MTTIAFKDGVMAADSKCTDESGAFFTRNTKITRLSNGALVGSAGDVDDREVNALLQKAKAPAGKPANMPTRSELAATKTRFDGILAFPNGRVFGIFIYDEDVGLSSSEWNAQVVEIEERMTSVGSGYQFALGAMAAGKTAAEAVHVACKYDSYSQAPVREVKVKSG